MAGQGEAIGDDARAADAHNQAHQKLGHAKEGATIEKALHGADIRDIPRRARPRGTPNVTAKTRQRGQQGRQKRSSRAELTRAEEGAVVPQQGVEPRPGEALVPDPKLGSYDAIDEVLKK